MPRRIAVLGSTGSIGVQTLQVIEALGDGYRAVSLAARSSWERLAEQCLRLRPDAAALEDAESADRLRHALGSASRTRVLSGTEGICELVSGGACDLVVAGIVGRAGLEATLGALESGIDVALANKETLVVAGDLVCRTARRTGARLIPVDSEHCAIDQALRAGGRHEVARLLLTSSGGPFRTRPLETFGTITPEEALRHPTWSMGPKITIDSATLMNKALEVIEAKYLFDVPPDAIEVVVHPQSIVHSLVEFRDGSVIAQLGLPDMRLPILYALTHPDRVDAGLPRLDLTRAGALTFERADPGRYPALNLGYEAARAGGASEAGLNAANEVAVGAFLGRRIPFLRIAQVLREILSDAAHAPSGTLDQALDADRRARDRARAALAPAGAAHA